MPLSDTAARSAKPSQKPQKLVDSGGLYLFVSPTGGKLWRLDYRFNSKRKTLALGAYPAISLKDARERRDEARKLLANGTDPGEVKQAQKQARQGNTFEALANEWMSVRGKEWTESYASKIKTALARHAFPSIGRKQIGEIQPPALLAMLRAIESRGTVDMAHRVQQHCGGIFRYAVSTGRATHDPTTSLRGAPRRCPEIYAAGYRGRRIDGTAVENKEAAPYPLVRS